MDIKRFVGNLFLGSKAFDPASQQFHAVDQERLVKDLEIEARAKRLGEENLPNPNAKRRDEIARDIDSSLGETLRRGRDDVTDHFKAAAALDPVLIPAFARIYFFNFETTTIASLESLINYYLLLMMRSDQEFYAINDECIPGDHCGIL